ncbi:MAG: hypothetical protein MR646_03785 [Agathobacter sp.]|nr:hypothetical protein [Agathobacter sp.]
MGAQDNTEKVLRSLHVLLSKSEPYPKEPSKVIIDKQQVLDLLAELNTCIYQIMDEYELTKQSRDKAEREFHKKGDQIIWDASRKAEDVYAASVMYMDETLNRMQDILKAADEKVGSIYKNIREEMEKEERAMKTNQLELKGQLQDLVDTEKYLKLIEERNREIEKEKHEGMPEYEQEKKAEKAIYADRQTGIKVNQEYLDKLGLSPVEDEKTPEIPRAEEDDEELRQLEAEIRVNLDADYFQWKDEKESSGEEPAEEKEEKPAGFQKKLKNLIGGHIHDNPGL